MEFVAEQHVCGNKQHEIELDSLVSVPAAYSAETLQQSKINKQEWLTKHLAFDQSK